MSFESYLNYDMTVYKRKERSGMRKPPKKPKLIPSEQQIKDPVIKNMELAPKQVYLSRIFAYGEKANLLMLINNASLFIEVSGACNAPDEHSFTCCFT